MVYSWFFDKPEKEELRTENSFEDIRGLGFDTRHLHFLWGVCHCGTHPIFTGEQATKMTS